MYIQLRNINFTFAFEHPEESILTVAVFLDPSCGSGVMLYTLDHRAAVRGDTQCASGSTITMIIILKIFCSWVETLKCLQVVNSPDHTAVVTVSYFACECYC